jgi:DUF1680 family protein
LRISRREFSQILACVTAAPAVHRALASAPIFSDPATLQATAAGRRRLTSFDYKGVTLDGGPLRRQFDEICDYYLKIPNDDLLKGFRLRSGLPAPGIELGGWYSRDFFNIFGQILSGLSRMYAATGNPEVKAKLDFLLAEWAKTIAPDGFFYYSSMPNARLYTYEKMVGGLLDASLYGQNPNALSYLSRVTDWAIKNLNRGRPYSFNAGFDNEAGGTEWYTLTENLYRAYTITGDPKYRDFGAYWEYKQFWDLFAKKQDIFSPFGNDNDFRAYHAYSHVNSLSGAGAAYLLTGDEKYLATLENGYDFVFNKDSFATGGFGPNERLMPPQDDLSTLLRLDFHFETQCGTWAIFKLSKYLVSITGDAQYCEWPERAMINGIGASLPMSPDGGVFYYSDYNIQGGVKANHNPWSCCAGTRPMAAADFHDVLYFHDSNGLFVAQFAQSTVNWKHNDATVKLCQRTGFPEEDKTEFHLEMDRPAAFELAVRIPHWLSAPMQISVNGVPTPFKSRDNWAIVSQNWKSGDVVTATLPAALWLAPAPGATHLPAAVMRGPVAMAFRAPAGNPSAQIDLANLDRSLQVSPGEPLTYHVASAEGVLMRPFYEYKEGERYYMYLHDDLPQWEHPWAIQATPAAKSTPWFSFTDSQDALIEYSFTGTSIRWSGYRFEDGGKAAIWIDGKQVDTIDQFGASAIPLAEPGQPSMAFEWSRTGLSDDRHLLQIRTLYEKNDASKGYRITVAKMDSSRV